jgi:uncharacterized membrane protein YphA (DoxX/SURF4 family)
MAVEGRWLVPILLAVAGLGSLTGGIACIIGAVRRRRRGQRAAQTFTPAIGRVIDRYLPPGSATGTNPPRYTIDFTAADRRVVRFITDSVGWKPKEIGDTVDVLYNPADPEDACVRGGEPVAAWLFTTAGVIFTIIGLFMTLSAVGLVMDRSAR